jgi:hypothetical protein
VSNINFLGINENFPVSGQDNDTQVFRDNFDTIKKSLRSAKDEITALEDTGTGAARLNATNDFNLNIIQNAVFQNVREKKLDNGTIELDPAEGGANPTYPIEFELSSYHILRVSQDTIFNLVGLAGDPVYDEENTQTVTKMMLELYSDDGEEKIITIATSDGTKIKRNIDFPATGVDFGSVTFSITSSDNPIIIEVWRHRQQEIFVKYIGEFTDAPL